MSVPVRNTKKSRMVSEFVDCMVETFLNGEEAISKTDLVRCVVTNSLSSSAPISVQTLMEDELANEVDRYWSDIVKSAAEAIDLPHHMVTAKFWKMKKKPETESEAQQYVAAFANGRGRKADGVRFVPADQGTDVLLAVALGKRVANTESINKATADVVNVAIEKGALPSSYSKKIGNE